MIRVLFYGFGSGIGGIITALGTDYMSSECLIGINFLSSLIITLLSMLIDNSIEENEFATMKDPAEAALILKYQRENEMNPESNR